MYTDSVETLIWLNLANFNSQQAKVFAYILKTNYIAHQMVSVNEKENMSFLQSIKKVYYIIQCMLYFHWEYTFCRWDVHALLALRIIMGVVQVGLVILFVQVMLNIRVYLSMSLLVSDQSQTMFWINCTQELVNQSMHPKCWDDLFFLKKKDNAVGWGQTPPSTQSFNDFFISLSSLYIYIYIIFITLR